MRILILVWLSLLLCYLALMSDSSNRHGEVVHVGSKEREIKVDNEARRQGNPLLLGRRRPCFAAPEENKEKTKGETTNDIPSSFERR